MVLGEAAKEADAGAPLTSAAAARAGGGKGIGGTGGRSSRRRLGSQTLPRGGKRGAAGDGGSRMARPCRLEPRIDIPARSRRRGLGRPWMETGGGGGAFARGKRSTLRPPPPPRLGRTPAEPATASCYLLRRRRRARTIPVTRLESLVKGWRRKAAMAGTRGCGSGRGGRRAEGQAPKRRRSARTGPVPKRAGPAAEGVWGDGRRGGLERWGHAAGAGGPAAANKHSADSKKRWKCSQLCFLHNL